MKPALVLLHGMLNHPGVWQGVCAALASAASVHLPRLTEQTSIAQMAADAWQALAQLPPATPVVLAGHSMGGYVAIEMLAQARRPVAALALVSTNTAPEPAENHTARERLMAALEQRFELTLDSFIPLNLCPHSAGNAAITQAMRRMMTEVGPQAAVRQIRALMARSDHRALLAGLSPPGRPKGEYRRAQPEGTPVSLPVLVACGRHDQVLPLALSQASAALIPGAVLAVHEDSGHMLPLERPAELAAQLQQLVQRLT